MRIILFFLLSFIASTNTEAQKSYYPDGYYFPNTEIKKGNWNFEWMGIMIEPVKDFKNFVSARFRNLKTDKWIVIQTKKYRIKRDSTSITFNNKLTGELIISGHFTHHKVPYDDKSVTSKTIVFVSSYKSDNKTIPVSFTWGEGD